MWKGKNRDVEGVWGGKNWGENLEEECRWLNGLKCPELREKKKGGGEW